MKRGQTQYGDRFTRFMLIIWERRIKIQVCEIAVLKFFNKNNYPNKKKQRKPKTTQVKYYKELKIAKSTINQVKY